MTSRPPKAERRGPFFFLNPYVDFAFTRCPKCNGKTKVRKLPLVIHVEPHTLCALNKTCRVCPGCALVRAKKLEIEDFLRATFGRQGVIEEGDYVVVGTLDRAVWRTARNEQWSSAKTLDHASIFKDHLHFVIQGGWQLDK